MRKTIAWPVIPIAVIVSLYLLTLVMYYHRPDKSARREIAIKQFLPSEKATHNMNGWRTLSLYKDYKMVSYTIADKDQNSGIQYIRKCAKELKKQPGIKQYLRIQLNPENSYGQIVKLIDALVTDGHLRYMIWQDNFYIFPPQTGDPETGLTTAL